jgi:tetratricopeptide (TPR) repeat protein
VTGADRRDGATGREAVLPAAARVPAPRAPRGLAVPAPVAALLPRALPWLLAAAVLAVFSPALHNEFVEWDDFVNLLENPHYRGLGWAQLRWMTSNTLMGHYIPVTWLTFGLDYVLWGMDPFGYHLTNALLHAANAAVFFLVARRLLALATALTGPALQTGAAMAALFFAFHPLRAESVAWATERRDVLSGLFYLLAVLCYLRAAAPGARRRGLLAASVGCFALGLLSKSIVMTLRLTLLVLDVYPLGRLPWLPWRWTGPAARAVLREKVPFAIAGIAGGAVAYWAVAHQDYLTPMHQYPWSARLGMTFYSYWFYLAKTVWPVALSPLYELPAVVDPLAPRFAGAAVGVVAVTAAVLLLAIRARWPAGLAVWLAYGLFLGPVTGIVHSGHQLTHDRYSYLSCLGFALLFGAAVGVAAQDRALRLVRPALVRAAAAVAAVWVLALGALAWYQVQVWRDTESLWRHAIEADEACAICQSNLGSYLLKAHAAYPQARHHLERTIELRPDRHRPRSNYGLVLAQLGETEAALHQLHLAVAHHPWDADALSNLAGVLIGRQRHDEARAYLTRGLLVKPDHAALLANMGALLTATGRHAEAIAYLRRSVTRKPDDPIARLLLARAYLAAGDFDRAGETFVELARLDTPAARRLADGLTWF